MPLDAVFKRLLGGLHRRGERVIVSVWVTLKRRAVIFYDTGGQKYVLGDKG